MSKTYIVKKGDTLAKIALATMGDAKLAATLADYNALANLKDIGIGQALHIPGRADLKGPKAPPAGARAAILPWPAPPQGMQAIMATFGDLTQYPPVGDNQPNPKWESDFIVSARLPQPIPLTFNMAASAKSLRCHKLVAPLYEAVFLEVFNQGLWGSIQSTAGGYNWRMKRGQAKPSTHTWGIAFDLNDRTNAMGTAGDMDPALVALFESHGFTWGGRWSGAGKDPMHFQYCSGY